MSLYLTIHLNRREDIFPKNLQLIRALCLRKEEILAEKIRALIQRKQPRDLYDIWFLRELGVEVKKDLVKKKLKVVGIEEMGQDILNKFSKKGYQEDLKNLVINPPKFSEVLKVVKDTISSIE